jgi:glycosyltransferase involved in cell wall biosynthesis
MNSNNPLVSILIPCYNAEAWVKQCIESALQQTYPNKEVIIIDDGSTDGSAGVIDRFRDKITFKRAANSGANATRNELTRLAQGEWLQYLDADDYFLPGKVESDINLLSTSKGELDVIYSPMIHHDTAKPERDYTVKITADDEIVNYIRWIPFGTHSMLLRRQSVLAVGGWNPDQPCCQEHELLLRLLLAESRFAQSQTPGAVYRHHGSNTISTLHPMRVIRIRMSLTDRLEQHLKSSGQLNSSHRAALFVARMESARSAFDWDRKAAEDFCSRAFENGSHWSDASPALPWSYRLAVGLAGFRGAELLARRLRKS